MKWISTFWLILLCKLSFATHIVGGELNYTHVHNNLYKIQLKLYVDCYNGNPGAISQDATAIIGVFNKRTGTLISNLSVEVPRTNPVRVSKTFYNCISIAPNACVDAYNYDTLINLPPFEDGYILSFQRCCRNNTIINLINPESTGANFFTVINNPDTVGYNSSPYFKNLPPNFICTNATLVFDHGGTDADGDSLAYEFFHPYTAASPSQPRPELNNLQKPPFPKVVYQSGYSFDVAIDALPAVDINAKTGILTVTPTQVGQFVIGIVVKEFRNGQLIGFTQRDYQFNVQNCVFETVSAFASPEYNCNQEVFFTNNSQKATNFKWDFGDSTTNADTSNQKTVSYRYPKAGDYEVTLIASNGNCADTQIKIVTIYEKLKFKLPPDTIICGAYDYNITPDTAFSNATYLWSTGATTNNISINSSGTYWLKMTFMNCDGFDTVMVTYDTTNISLRFSDLICQLPSLKYNGTVHVVGDYNSIKWSAEPDLIPPNYSGNSYTFEGINKFKIKGLTPLDCPYNYESEVKQPLKLIPKINIPNVVTPNNDNLNDVFPELNPNYLYKLVVYDRWGTGVFTSENNPWTAIEMLEGTYYYYLKVNTCDIEKEIYGVISNLGGKK